MFTDKELYNYLVLNKERTCDGASNNASRQLKAKVFYEDNHVHSISYHGINESMSHCYVSCKVIPSCPTGKKEDYRVWVCMSKVTGHVHSACCTCTAGEGESCNHIAGLLYALVDVNQKKDTGLNSVTSEKCKWNQPRKRKLTPKKSQDLKFKKHKFENVHTTRGRRLVFDERKNIRPVDKEWFAQKLIKLNSNACWLYTVSTNTNNNDDEYRLFNVPFMYRDSISLRNSEIQRTMCEEFTNLCESVTREKIKQIEADTKGQALNGKWSTARRGILTSSSFGLVCKRRETTEDSIIRSVLHYRDFKSKSTDWGIKHEAAAKRVYLRKARELYNKVVLQECGLALDEDNPFLGSSPDGLIECDGLSGVLEVKCPFKYRFLDPVEAAKQSDFFCNIENGQVVLKRNSNYYYQIQGQMAITKRKFCDFFVWTLTGSTIERIHFDSEFWDSTLKTLTSFYLKYIVPELFSERVKRGKSLFLKAM